MRQRAKVAPLVLPKGRRAICVSDIHGNLKLLRGLLDRVGFCREDILIVLGDILERHVDSLATLRYLLELSRTHTLYFVLGNCDNLVLDFVYEQGELPDGFFERWLGNLGRRSVLTQMAELAGIPLNGREDYPRARRVFQTAFAPELELLGAMPHILLNDDYLLVHGGVPREEGLEELVAFDCMKNDSFLNQGHAFRRWLVVGHTPVTLYREDIASAAPIIDRARHIASIDGGCTLKWDGQLNALILPEAPGGDFSWVGYDGLAEVTALADQEASRDSVNIRFGHSELEVLEAGTDFSLCRHVETGRVLRVLTEYLYHKDGKTFCEDYTDYLLPVRRGDRLSVVRRVGYELLAKKDGVTGWYLGGYEEG